MSRCPITRQLTAPNGQAISYRCRGKAAVQLIGVTMCCGCRAAWLRAWEATFKEREREEARARKPFDLRRKAASP
jgi:hypothetical protein